MRLNACSDAFAASPVDDVDAFMHALADCSLDDWLILGANKLTLPRAAAALQEIVVAHGLCFDAWLACDAIKTLAFLASRSLPPRPQRCHRAMERSRLVAEEIALALLARPWLTRGDFDELVAPVSARSVVRNPLRAA
jgi:hypothetical protein